MCNFPTKLSVKNENVSFREHLFIYEKKNSRKHHNCITTQKTQNQK